MRGSAAVRTGVAPGGVLAGPWVKNELWRRARAVPSLDLRFADDKSLTDAVTGQSLITFTRASSGTFVDSAGVIQTATTDVPRFDHNPTTGESLGLLVEEARTNNLLQSEDFSSTWTISNIAVTANSVVAPDGTTTADTIAPPADGLTVTRFLRQNPVLTTQQAYTLSVFVKVGTATTTGIALYVSDSTATNIFRANFNLFNLTTSLGNTGWAVPTATIVPYPNGWYRCILTGVTSTAHVSLRALIYLNAFGTTSDTYGTHHIWGAQLEAGAFATSYIPTTTATATRSADVASITGANFGTTRTNLVLQSETFATTWTTGNATVPVSGQTTPAGTTNANSLTGDGTNSTHLVSQNVTFTAAAHTLSVYAKKGTNNFLQVRIGATAIAAGTGFANFNLDTGVVGTVGAGISGSSIIPAGNGWYRCSITGTTLAAASNVGLYLVTSATAVSAELNTLTTTVNIWGAQLETGSAVTPYIPTTTAAVSVFESSWYNQTEGTVFWEGSRTRTTGFPERFNLSDGTANNRIFSYWDAGANSSTFNVTSGSVDQGSIFGAGSALLSTAKSAFGLATNNTAAVYNGSIQGTDTTVTLPTASQLTIGASLTGTIRRLTYWPTRLANNVLQEVTR